MIGQFRGQVYELEGRGIVDRMSFVGALRATVPLDPPLMSSRSWDAIEDSIFGGLCQLSDVEQIAVVWRDFGTMERADPLEFAMAVNVFKTVASQLARDNPGGGRRGLGLYLFLA